MSQWNRERGFEKKRSLKHYSIGFLLLLCFLCLAFFGYLGSCPLPKNAAPQVVDIPYGASTREIASILREKSIIRSPFLFDVLARILGKQEKFQAGEYSFEPGIFVWDVMKSLASGKVIYYTLTVREGLSVEEIGSLIEKRGFGSKEKFLETVAKSDLRPWFLSAEDAKKTRYPLEGYLFPDTYYVRKGMSEEELVSMMFKRFQQVFTRDIEAKAQKLGLSCLQVATLASIVEKEAQVPEERPIIAAVYLNRLKIGMKLDADPTVSYAAGKYGLAPTLKDLEVDSPYNTYKYAGLPPGPISNFGKASLDAVLNPANVDYLYFVSRNDGTHAFARTLEEHNHNVQIYQGH